MERDFTLPLPGHRTYVCSILKYRRKRSAARTPEPFGREVASPSFREQRYLRRTKTRGAAPSLRFSTRDGRRPALMGRSERPLDESRRQASCGRRRRPSARVRRLRRRDSARQLRRGLGHRVGSRHLRGYRSAWRCGRRGPQRKNRHQPARLQTQRRVHARAHRWPRAMPARRTSRTGC